MIISIKKGNLLIIHYIGLVLGCREIKKKKTLLRLVSESRESVGVESPFNLMVVSELHAG